MLFSNTFCDKMDKKRYKRRLYKMNEKEWIEYFELIHGRKPKPEEFSQALKNGEFIDDRGNKKSNIGRKKYYFALLLMSFISLALYVYTCIDFDPGLSFLNIIEGITVAPVLIVMLIFGLRGFIRTPKQFFKSKILFLLVFLAFSIEFVMRFLLLGSSAIFGWTDRDISRILFEVILMPLPVFITFFLLLRMKHLDKIVFESYFKKIIVALFVICVMLPIGTVSFMYYSYQNSFEQQMQRKTWFSLRVGVELEKWEFTSSYKLHKSGIDNEYDNNLDYTSYSSYSEFKEENNIVLSQKEIISDFKKNFKEIKDTRIKDKDLKFILIQDEDNNRYSMVFLKLNKNQIYYLYIFDKQTLPGILFTPYVTNLSGNYKINEVFGSKTSDEENQRKISNFPVWEFSHDKVISNKKTRYLMSYEQAISSYNLYPNDKLKSKEAIIELLKSRGYQLKDTNNIYVLVEGYDISRSFFIVPVENRNKIFMGYLRNDSSNEENNILIQLEKIQLKE